MTRRIAVIGAGIVGTLVARELAGDDTEVTVVERAPAGTLPGSTGHAPGFVGLYNEDEAHVPLAVRSARMYDAFPESFRRVGAYDVADTEEGAQQLLLRAAAARACGLDVTEVPVAQAVREAPALVDPDRIVLALHSPGDGAAGAVALTLAAQADARARGVRFVFGAHVRGIDVRGGGIAVGWDEDEVVADDVVLAAGLWGSALAERAGVTLPLVPVGHPYIYSAPQRGLNGGPLVRFREHGIYARAHGDRIGMGCYAHDVYDATAAISGPGAEVEWPDELFDPVVNREISVLPPASRFLPQERLNGVFSMTPDGRPYIGSLGQAGLWTAQAIWVTHAGGAAQLLAGMIRDGAEEDARFAPTRFAGQDPDDLRRRALALY